MSKTNKKYTTAISACLVGEPCRWNGKNAKNQKAVRIFGQGTSLPICPEILGKLSTPRPACEIVGGDGTDVLQGGAQVCDAKGTCYTKKFVSGARYAVDMIKKNGITMVYLKTKSPSCGLGRIYSGSFNGSLKKGDGIFAALLKQNNITIKNIE